MNLVNGQQFENLALSEPKPGILLLRLNRPNVRNALNTSMIQELGDLWRALYADSGELKSIILTGAGDKAFCAGADLKERHTMSSPQWLAQHALLEQTMKAMFDCPLPIIAAANGIAYGGGLELLLSCDFAYAAPSAQFAFPESKLGIIPGAMGTQWLPRIAGINRAKEICLTGEPFGISEALDWGVVNKCIEHGELLSAAIDTAQKIALNGPIAVRQLKKALNATLSTAFMAGYDFEIEAYNQCIDTEDRVEGIKAFNEKRKANFQGK